MWSVTPLSPAWSSASSGHSSTADFAGVSSPPFGLAQGSSLELGPSLSHLTPLLLSSSLTAFDATWMLTVMTNLSLPPDSRLVHPTVYLKCLLGCLIVNSNLICAHLTPALSSRTYSLPSS